ncbi:MAG: phytanoyl-CoA dioxygenase family protein [Candidatus Latescibacterota bacterium]
MRVFLRGFYADRIGEMRERFHDLIARTEGRPKAMSYDLMAPVDGYPPDPYNPRNVRGIMDHPLADDYWFNHVVEPRMLRVFVDLLGPDLDFHNGKVRNNPPGFTNVQGWHQDWPYERHTIPALAASLTYLEDNERDAGATSVIPGTHVKGEWPTLSGSHSIAPEILPEEQAVTVSVQPGDVLIIHVLVVHSAGHNHTPQSRHKIINEYKTRAAVDCWGNKCAFAGLPLARGGRIVAHPV